MKTEGMSTSKMKMKTACSLWALSFILAVGFPTLGLASLPTGESVVPKEVERMLTHAEQAAIASVDGDPDFIVGVRGLDQPLCFRVEGQPGHVVRLLQDPESGVVVNARISRPVPESTRTYLSAVLIARRNFRVVVKVGRVLVNRYRFAWGPVSVRLIHGHRVVIAPTLLALTLRNLNVTLIVKRHLPEGRRRPSPSGANDTDTNSRSNSPSIASLTPDVNSRHHNGSNVVIAARATRRRASRRRRPEDIDHGPRPRNRRHRRRQENRRKKKKGGEGDKPSAKNSRKKRETKHDISDFTSLVGRNLEPTESRFDRLRLKNIKDHVYHVNSLSKTQDDNVNSYQDNYDNSNFEKDSVRLFHVSSENSDNSDVSISGEGLRKSISDRSRRSTSAKSQNSSKRRSNPSRDARKRKPKGSRSRGDSRREPNRRSRKQPLRNGSGSSSGRSRKGSGRNSRRSSGKSRRTSPSDATPAQVMLKQADDAGRNSSASGDGGVSSGNGGSSGGDVSSGGALMRDMAAYVGFYVADARDLSSRTHGLLGQFLHRAVTLQRVRQKANGVMKARLLVNKPRPRHVKATLRTRTNMALNSSSTCWWLREGGLGVVDGVYTDYLVSRFRATDFLPLPPSLIGQ